MSTSANRLLKPKAMTAWGGCVLLFYVLVVALFQGGWRKAGATCLAILIACGIVSVAVSLVRRSSTRPVQSLARVLILATILWFYFSGSYRYRWSMLWDVFGIALGAGAAVLFERILAQRCRASLPARAMHGWRDASLVLMIIAGWVGVSLVSYLREKPLSVNPARLAQIGPANSIVPTYAQNWAHLRIGLALSGGGYRAALFHAGVLHALERLGIHINVLSTVSGGSIIGAYYASGGDPAEFKNAVAEGRFNLVRQLMLLQNAARLPFPLTIPGSDIKLAWFYRFGRLDVEANLLRSSLFKGINTWQEPATFQPELLIATTDLTYGLEIGLIPDGVVTVGPNNAVHAYRGKGFHPEDPLDLAQRVAISGAVPVAFPSYRLQATFVTCNPSGVGARVLQLADGGIADNRGTDLLLAANHLAGSPTDCFGDSNPEHRLLERWQVDAMIASNGGAIFGVDEAVSGIGLVSRAFDVGGLTFGQRSRKCPDMNSIQISVQDAFLDINKQFLLTHGKSAAEGVALDAPRVDVDPRQYPPEVLTEIVSLLPETVVAQAKLELAAYTKVNAQTPELDASTQQLWRELLPRVQSAKECRDRLVTGGEEDQIRLRRLPGICEAIALRSIISSELKRSVNVFKETSTLEDWPRDDGPETLFRLGQFMVYTRWLDIRRRLDAASSSANGRMPEGH